MKKLIALLLAVLLFASLCACGSGESVTFKNDLSSSIHGVYISPTTDEEWTDRLNYAIIRAGGSITIDFEKFAGDTPYYDVGVVDENNMNYDVYEVPLAIGDTLALSAENDVAVLTVTSTDGSVKTYDGYAYEGEESE